MKVKYKRRLTYFTIGFFFLLGGVEYAVILPTLWLYLETYFDSQSYMLGIVLSAFSLSSLMCAPIFGIWSDKTSNTKAVILVANVFSFVGSCMYSLGISDWFLVGSRFIAGIGSGVGAAIMGDIARTTSTQERTSVISLFMAVRQFGLLAGPGLNLFLRELDFSIGPVTINKYTAPGVFMGMLWIIHEILVIFIYWNLPGLKKDEEKEILKENVQYPSQISINSNLEDHSSSIFEHSNSYSPLHNPTNQGGNNTNNMNQDDLDDELDDTRPSCTFEIGSAPLALARQPSVMSTSSEAIVSIEKYMSALSTSPSYLQYSDVYAQNTTTDDGNEKSSVDEKLGDVGNSRANNTHLLEQDLSNNQSINTSNLISSNSSNAQQYTSANEYHSDNIEHQQQSLPPQSPLRGQNVTNLSSKVITSTPRSRKTRTNPSGANTSYGAISNVPVSEEMSSPVSGVRDGICDSYNEVYSEEKSGEFSTNSREPVTLSLRYLADEFVREEVVVVLATVFTAFFGQLVLETACTPLTKLLLGWGELGNSLLYCGAGLEILLVFLLISWLSKRLHDRYLLLLGYVFLVLTLIFITYFIPTAVPGQYTRNLIGLIAGIALDIFSIPFLAVVGTSLYSKITRPETQGLAQGIRRATVGIATILGPLWAGSLLDHLFVMYGVCLALSALVMVMLLLSFKHLKEDNKEAEEDNSVSQNDTSHVSTNENSPLLA